MKPKLKIKPKPGYLKDTEITQIRNAIRERELTSSLSSSQPMKKKANLKGTKHVREIRERGLSSSSSLTKPKKKKANLKGTKVCAIIIKIIININNNQYYC